MRRAFYCALLCAAGCYDLAALPHLHHNDGGTDAGSPDGGAFNVYAGAIGGAGAADGPSAATFVDRPSGVCVDAANNVFVTDAGSFTILRIDAASGKTQVVAGRPYHSGHQDGASGTSTIGEPRHCIILGRTLYFTDFGGSSVRALALDTFTLSTIAGAGHYVVDATGFGEPWGITSDGNTLYIADQANNDVRSLDLTTHAEAIFCGTPSVAGYAEGACSGAKFAQPEGIVSDGSGDLYIADTNNRLLREISIDAQTTQPVAGMQGVPGPTPGAFGAMEFDDENSLVFDGAHTLYVSDSQVLFELDLTTLQSTILFGNASESGSTDGAFGQALIGGTAGPLALDQQGALLLGDRDYHRLRKVDLGAQQVSTLIGKLPNGGTMDGSLASARFSAPGFVTAANGTLYISDLGNERLRTISGGMVSTLAGNGTQAVVNGASLSASFVHPNQIAVASDRTVYVADSSGGILANNIRVIAGGMVSTLAGPTNGGPVGAADGPGAMASFNAPTGLALDEPNQRLFVADSGSGLLRYVDLSNAGATVSTLTLSGDVQGCNGSNVLNSVNGLYFAQQTLYVAAPGNCAVVAIDLTNLSASTIVPAQIIAGGTYGYADATSGTAAQLEWPSALALDPARQLLYVADYNAALLRTIDLGAANGTHTLLGVPERHGIELAPTRLNRPVGIALWEGGVVLSSKNENAILWAPAAP